MMPPPAPVPSLGLRDPLAWYTTVHRYLQTRQVPRHLHDDLAHEMLVLALEDPRTHYDLWLVYLHASARLDPRIRSQGARVPISTRTCVLGAWDSMAPDDPERAVMLAEWFAQIPKPMQVAVWRIVMEGWTAAEVAAAWGIDPSTLSRRLRALRHHPRPA